MTKAMPGTWTRKVSRPRAAGPGGVGEGSESASYERRVAGFSSSAAVPAESVCAEERRVVPVCARFTQTNFSPSQHKQKPPSLQTGVFVLIYMPGDLPASSELVYSSSSSGIGLLGGGGRLPIVTVSSAGLPRRITFIFTSAPGFNCAIALSRAVVSEID